MEPPPGLLKDHILVVLRRQDIRRLIGFLWLWCPVLLPLCGELRSLLL